LKGFPNFRWIGGAQNYERLAGGRRKVERFASREKGRHRLLPIESELDSVQSCCLRSGKCEPKAHQPSVCMRMGHVRNGEEGEVIFLGGGGYAMARTVAADPWWNRTALWIATPPIEDCLVECIDNLPSRYEARAGTVATFEEQKPAVPWSGCEIGRNLQHVALPLVSRIMPPARGGGRLKGLIRLGRFGRFLDQVGHFRTTIIGRKSLFSGIQKLSIWNA